MGEEDDDAVFRAGRRFKFLNEPKFLFRIHERRHLDICRSGNSSESSMSGQVPSEEVPVPPSDEHAKDHAEVEPSMAPIKTKVLDAVDSVAQWLTGLMPEELDEKLAEAGCETFHEFCMSHGRHCDMGAAVCFTAGRSRNEENARLSLQRFREFMRAQRNPMQGTQGEKKEHEKKEQEKK